MENVIYFIVKGRVQGVGFRYFVQKTANSKLLKGWVRNLFDGRVEGVVLGDSGNIEIFLEEIYRGPELSDVQDLQTKAIENTASYDNFNIEKDGDVPWENLNQKLDQLN